MARELSKIRNIGISAHIDSGKTTLTERILFYTGRIHAIHEVRGKDGVGAKMDSMDLEREKGITIQSAATYCEWKDNNINIIDTPGHVDFTVEVERSLRVLDGAILVLCGTSGVQSQSITVDRQMKRYNVPRIAFINKLDRAGADPFRVTEQLREKLHLNAAVVQLPIGLEDQHAGIVDIIEGCSYSFLGDDGEKLEKGEIPDDMKDLAAEKRQLLIETLADADDDLGEKFLMEEEISNEDIKDAIRRAVIALKFVPVFMGSAFKNKGVQPLLDGVLRYLPNPTEVPNVALNQADNEAEVEVKSDDSLPLVALAFKLEEGRYGQLTYMRIYQGKMSKGDTIFNISSDKKKIKVPRIVQMHSDEMVDIDSASAGDIVAMFGVDCSSGDTFTDGKVEYTMTSMFVPNAVISLAVTPKDKSGQANFSKALNRFTKQDPTLRVHRDEESGETILSGMGELHLEVYIERIKREYSCDVQAGKPLVAFREAISQRSDYNYTHKKQSGGSGQFARIKMKVMPQEPGLGYEFESKIVGGSIPKEYIPGVEKGINSIRENGLLVGFPILDFKVELYDGAFHDVDSSVLAFEIAARGALRENKAQLGLALLEPVMKVEVVTPEEYTGTVIGDLNSRRGQIQDQEMRGNANVVHAMVPLANMFGYVNNLRSATQGRANYTMQFDHYEQVPKAVEEEVKAKLAG